jgi:hypothetical protein
MVSNARRGADARRLLTYARLTIINAIQLAVAIVANVFLLLNMARRLRFTIAQPITMAGWYVFSHFS